MNSTERIARTLGHLAVPQIMQAAETHDYMQVRQRQRRLFFASAGAL